MPELRKRCSIKGYRYSEQESELLRISRRGVRRRERRGLLRELRYGAASWLGSSSCFSMELT
jgi:hypothetical protein